MSSLSQTKKILIAVTFLVLSVLLYITYFKPSTVSLDTSSSSELVGQDILDSLAQLQTVSIDPGIFSGPLFQGLTSFNMTVQPESQGRPDPFAPLAGTVIKK